MSWENAPTRFTERVHQGLLPQDRSGTSCTWRALVLQVRHNERLRIARELHDTLFQGFLSASMQLCYVDTWLPAGSPAKPVLRRALELMRKGLDEGRNALRGLRSTPLPEGSLEKALSDIHGDFAPTAGGQTRLGIVIVGESRPLEPAVQEQIYWIAREAQLNALQHATASHVETQIEYLPRRLRVVVRDNGTGIDPEVLRTGKDSHYGLKGMKERAASIGAKLRVWSKRGGGTEVEISLRIDGPMKK